jgi:hypothetical protein
MNGAKFARQTSLMAESAAPRQSAQKVESGGFYVLYR